MLDVHPPHTSTHLARLLHPHRHHLHRPAHRRRSRIDRRSHPPASSTPGTPRTTRRRASPNPEGRHRRSRQRRARRLTAICPSSASHWSACRPNAHTSNRCRLSSRPRRCPAPTSLSQGLRRAAALPSLSRSRAAPGFPLRPPASSHFCRRIKPVSTPASTSTPKKPFTTKMRCTRTSAYSSRSAAVRTSTTPHQLSPLSPLHTVTTCSSNSAGSRPPSRTTPCASASWKARTSPS